MLLAEEISTSGDGIIFAGGIAAALFTLVVVGVAAWFLVETDEDEDQIIVLGFRIWLLGIVVIVSVIHIVSVAVSAATAGK